jgi:preprotein translocase subunit YajC
MFATPAFASTGAASGSSAMIGQMIMFAMIGLLFWFLILRPQSQRAKQHKAKIDAVKKNDMAVTAGGLIGKVTKVDETEIELELAPNVRVRVIKAMLSEVRPHGTKPAND